MHGTSCGDRYQKRTRNPRGAGTVPKGALWLIVHSGYLEGASAAVKFLVACPPSN
jgi:hypothetical protein